MPTRWELHVEAWKDCTRCDAHTRRRNVVLGRGSVPCDVVFIGEAPGKSENSLGEPFLGPAGHRFDAILKDALAATPQVKYALTNLVGCIPAYVSGSGKLDKPDHDCIVACAPRLVEFVELASPLLIVCVGLLAEQYTSPWLKQGAKLLDADGVAISRVSITHPSAILQAKTAYQASMHRKCVIAIRDAVSKYVTNPQPREKIPVWEESTIPF